MKNVFYYVQLKVVSLFIVLAPSMFLLYTLDLIASNPKSYYPISTVLDFNKSSNDSITIMFWNVENYFDPFDDQLSKDEDFTFKGKYHWSWKRFVRKRNSIAKTIIAVSQHYGDYPLIIGLTEVENRLVLNQLLQETPLHRLKYKIVHRDSPDRRGIDVALLYRSDRLKLISSQTININLEGTTTRDILYVKGVVESKYTSDTLHIFVNHWPSKISGSASSSNNQNSSSQSGITSSSDRRMAASNTLSKVIDSIMTVSISATSLVANSLENSTLRVNSTQGNNIPIIIVMGDFNDTPDSDALKNIPLFNLAANLSSEGKGTIKYKGMWELIDQFLITKTMSQFSNMSIYSDDYLVEEDKRYLGTKPFRTYVGPRYNGGVSDHFPIVLQIKISK